MEKYLFWELDQRDGIADCVRNRARLYKGGGEGFSDGVVFYSIAKLYADGCALSKYFQRVSGKSQPSISLGGGGAYDVAAVLVAASRLGSSLTLSPNERAGDCHADIVIARKSSLLGEGGVEVAIEELSGAILCELSGGGLDIDPSEAVGRRGLTVGFLRDDGRIERYDEDTLLTIADAYARALVLLPWETTASTLSPASREGFFAGLLSPMLRAKKWICFSDDEGLFDEIRLSRPQKLVCKPRTADKLCRALKGEKRRGLDSLFLVATFGNLSDRSKEGLSRARICTAELLDSDGCAIAGYRRNFDRFGVWRLPRYLIADMREVESGGRGRLIFRGGGLALDGECSVSSLFGFPMGKGRFFVEKGRTL